MANVLPLEAQKRVSHIQRARFLIALAIAIGALAFFFALALTPSYLALSWATLPAESAASVDRSGTDTQALARAQALLVQFDTLLMAGTSTGTYIATAIESRPSGVTLRRIHYVAPSGDQAAHMQLVGRATRDKIAAYRDALSANPTFSDVSVPVSALVGSGGDFSMTLSIRDEKKTF